MLFFFAERNKGSDVRSLFRNVNTVPLRIAPSLGRNLSACPASGACTATVTIPLITPNSVYNEGWNRQFDFRMNERLHRALELKLFEDQKDSIKLSTMVSSVVDRETQEKIDIVKSRLIRNFGYDEESATDVLNFVASIFARGQTKK